MEVESGVRIWVSDGETMRDHTAMDANIGHFEIAYNLYVVARAHAESDGSDGAEMLVQALSMCAVNRVEDKSWSGYEAWNALCDAVEAAKKWAVADRKSEEAPDGK